MRRLVRSDGPRDSSPATDRLVAIIALTPNLGKNRAMMATVRKNDISGDGQQLQNKGSAAGPRRLRDAAE